MQGIPPELRRAIFVFNSDPYAVTVTYQWLLEYARSARLNLLESPTSVEPPGATSATLEVNTLQHGASNVSASNDEICALRQEIRELRTAFSENLAIGGGPNNVNAVYNSSHRGRFSQPGRGRGRSKPRWKKPRLVTWSVSKLDAQEKHTCYLS